MSRPGDDKPDWINDNTTGIETPTPAEQNAGWDGTFTSGLKPPRQWFNWFQNRVVQWLNWFSGQAGEYIVIDSTAGREKERDYAELSQYIADSPSAGDKILIKSNQTLSAQMVIPDDITLRILDGVTFNRAVFDAASVIKFGSNIVIEGVLNLILSHAGTTAKAIEIDGDNNEGSIIVENSSTGTITDAFALNAGVEGNLIHGLSLNTGAGAITNPLTDNSANNSNFVIVRDTVANIVIRSDGADRIGLADDADLLGGNNSAFYRNAGNLNAGTLLGARFNHTSHGDRAGGSLHPDVIAAGASGFMSGSDKAKLNALSGESTKAWVNFNGTGIVAIRDSFNVSSITDDGFGSYIVNYSSALGNANYAAVASAVRPSSDGERFHAQPAYNDDAPTTSASHWRTRNEAGTATDSPYVMVQVIGN